MIRKMVKQILAGKFDVLEASDGKTGLEAARKYIPDLILLDFVMPKYNGYQTLQAIRRFENLRNIPVIMISGLKEQVAEHVPEPFVGFEFLEKPFEAEMLLTRIQKLLHMTLPSTPTGGKLSEDSSQVLLERLNATEHLLIQGIENLIQREVASRIAELTHRAAKQEEIISSMEKKIDKLTQQLDNQNKGMMMILREVKALHASNSLNRG